MKIQIRPALYSDSEELIQLTQQTPMKGRISLRIDRGPDFFALSNARGESQVFIAYNKDHNSILGCFSCSIQIFYSFGKPFNVYYLADLKIKPEYWKSRVAYLLVNNMYIFLRSIGADFVFCTTVYDNTAILPFFKGRINFPKFQELAHFISYQILPRKGIAALSPEINNLELIQFYEKVYRNFSFHSSFSEVELCKHFIHKVNEEILSVISVFDPSHLKQNVVIKVGNTMDWFLRGLKFFKPFLSLGEIPSLNKPLKILFIKYYAFLNLEDGSFLNLIDQVRSYAFLNNYHLISISTDKKNTELNQVLKKKCLTQFESTGFITSINHDQEFLETLKNGRCYEDFSLS